MTSFHPADRSTPQPTPSSHLISPVKTNSPVATVATEVKEFGYKTLSLSPSPPPTPLSPAVSPLHELKACCQPAQPLTLKDVVTQSHGKEFLEQTKLFTHIHLDAFARGAEKFEGYSPEATTGYLYQMLTQFAQKKGRMTKEGAALIEQQLLPRLKQLHDQAKELSALKNAPESERHAKLLEAAQTTYQKVAALYAGESYLMSGGWSDKLGGHSILYRFTKQDNDAYELYIYNTGAGTDDYHSCLVQGRRDLIRPVVRYQGIRLFEIPPAFFQHLLEFATLLLWHPKQIEFRPADIYEKALGPFQSKRTSADQPLCDFMPAQRAGTCSWRVLIALLFHLLYASDPKKGLENRKLFRYLLYDLKLFSLVNMQEEMRTLLYEDKPAKRVAASQARTLLATAAKKFLAETARLFHPRAPQKPLLPLEEASIAYATASAILQEVQQAEERIAAARKKSARLAPLEPLDSSKARFTLAGTIQRTSALIIEPSVSPVSLSSPMLERITSPPKDFLKALQTQRERLAPLISQATELENLSSHTLEAITEAVVKSFTSLAGPKSHEANRIKERLRYSFSTQETLQNLEKFLADTPLFKLFEQKFKEAIEVTPENLGFDPMRMQFFKIYRFCQYFDRFCLEYFGKPPPAASMLIEIETLVTALPTPKAPPETNSYWDNLDVKELIPSLKALDNIGLYYAQHCLHPTAPYPERINTLYKLTAIAHYLAVRYDDRRSRLPNEPRLQEYGLYFAGADLDGDPYQVFYDPKALQTREEVLAYFAEVNRKAGVSDISDCLFQTFYPRKQRHDKAYHPGCQALDNETIDACAEYRYYQALIKAVPEREKAIRDCFKIEESQTLKSPICAMAALLFETSYRQNGYLQNNGLAHLLHLKNLTFLSSMFSGHVEGDSLTREQQVDLWRLFKGTAPPSLHRLKCISLNPPTLQVETTANSLQIPSDEHRITFPSKGMHRPTPPSIDSFLSTYNSHTKIPTEGSILVQKTWSYFPFEAATFARTNSTTLNRPHQILLHFRHHLQRLNEPEIQTLFDLLFFKHDVQQKDPTTGKRRCTHPLAELLPKEEALRKQCSEFLRNGLANFYLLQPNRRPDVHACLFFIRLDQRLRLLMPPHQRSSFIPEHAMILDDFLKREDLTDAERNAIHLHRITQYELIPPEKLTPQQISQIVASWIFYNHSVTDDPKTGPKWHAPQLRQQAENLIHALQLQIQQALGEDVKGLTTQTKELQDVKSIDRHSLFNKILKSLELPAAPSHCRWEAHFPIYRVTIDPEGKEYWEINLFTTQIGCAEGIIRFGAPPTWENSLLYKRLFGDRRFVYKEAGKKGTLFFTDRGINGEMRVINGDFERGVQRKIGHHWYQYVPPEAFDPYPIPQALLGDYSHWMPLDIQKRDHLYFCDRKTGKIAYVLSSTGKLAPWSEKKQTVEPNLSVTCFYCFGQAPSPKLLEPLSYFEMPTYLVMLEEPLMPTAKEGELQSLSLPRYQSLDGQPLRFERRPAVETAADKNGKDFKSVTASASQSVEVKSVAEPQPRFRLAWTDNPLYHLAEQQTGGLLGSCENYLLLQGPSASERKLLVPYQPIVNRADFSKILQLDIEGQETQATPSSAYAFQQGRYRFLEFQLEGDLPQPLNPEGALFLTYLSLAQRDYAQALHSLHQVRESDSLSSQSIQTLEWIIRLPKDAHPSAAAVRLQAALCLIAHGKNPTSKYTLAEEVLNAIDKNYNLYLSGLDHAAAELRLTPSQELEILALLPQQGVRARRKTYLERKAYPPERTAEPSARHEINQLAFYELNYPGTEQERLQEDFKQLYRREFGGYYIAPKLPAELLQGLNTSSTKTQSLITFKQTLAENFCQDYRIAREGTGPQKQELYRRLLMQQAYLSDSGTASKNAFEYLRFALHRGLDAPKLPPPNSSYEERKRWLLELYRLHENYPPFDYPARSSFFTPPSFSVAVTKAFEASNAEVARFAKFKLAAPLTRLLPPPVLPQTLIPLTAPPQPEETLQDLAETYLIAQSPSLNSDLKAPLQFDSAYAKEAEFRKAIEQEFELFEADFACGVSRNRAKKEYRLKTAEALGQLEAELDKRAQQEAEYLAQQKKAILQLANRKSQEPALQRHEALLEGSQALKIWKLPELVRCFQRKTFAAFGAVNPLLQESEIQELNQLIFDYLLHQTRLQRTKRASEYIRQMKLLPKEERGTQSYLLQQLGATLNAQRVYKPEEERELLVFESLSNLMIRPEQQALLKKMNATVKDSKTGAPRYKNLIAQLIMGGGKTSVLAAIIGYLSAQPGRLSLFICLSSQYNSVVANLRKSQWGTFAQDIQPIDLSLKELSLANLQWIEDRLKSAMAKGELVVMKNEMIHFLLLYFLKLLYTASTATQAQKIPEELAQKLSTLRNILTLFMTQTDALGDEVDVLLNVLKEVNLPVGAPSHLRPEYIDLIQTLYTHLSSDELEPLVGLRKNAQATSLTPEIYQEKVRPLLAQKLASYLSLPPQHEASFARYCCGSMDFRLQEWVQHADARANLDIKSVEAPFDPSKSPHKEDLAFLRWLHQQSLSAEEGPRESANLIALCKHFLQKILPVTLANSSKRNYGRTRSTHLGTLKPKEESAAPHVSGQTVGQVVPYLGVDQPASTLFASPLEAAANQFQEALNSGIAASQIYAVGKRMQEAAEHYVHKRHEAFDTTAEALQFKEMTSINLHEIDDPLQLEKAVKYLSKNREQLLSMEAATIAACVSSHEQRISSSPHLLARLFTRESSSFRGVSGTPWNIPHYIPALSQPENVHLDIGTEGEIADLLLRRNAPVHVVQEMHLQEMLRIASQNRKEGQKIRGIIDVGGLLKGYSTRAAAEEILTFYANDKSVQGVLFFDQPPDSAGAGERSKDTLWMLKKGPENSFVTVMIRGTRPEEIAKAGISPAHTFVYYDERHTTGTDIPQTADAINLLTIDEKMPRRNFFQGALRLRQLAFFQNIEYVTSAAIQQRLLSGGKNVTSFILSGIKNQAIRKSTDTYRAYKQQIHESAKEVALMKLLQPTSSVEQLLPAFRNHLDDLVTRSAASPYAQFGALETPVNPLKALEQQSKMHTALQQDRDYLQATETIRSAAKQSLYLPTTVFDSLIAESPLGLEQEILMEAEAQVEVQTEAQVDQELQTELDFYNKTPTESEYRETRWSPQRIAQLLDDFTQSDFKVVQRPEDFKCVDPEIKPLSRLFNERQDFGAKYAYAEYGKLFSANLYATKNFQLTFEQPVAVFHPAQKPANQILAMANGDKMSFLLLSNAEAESFKAYLQRSPRQNVWLLQPDGSFLIDNPRSPPTKLVTAALLQINAFNGTVEYLDKHSQETNSWLALHTLLKLRFLKLKVEHQVKQRTLFYSSPLFQGKKAQIGGYAGIKYAKRRNFELSLQERLKNYRPEDVAKLNVNEIPSIPHRLIPYLEKEEHIQALEGQQISHVTPQQVAKLHIWQIEHLTQRAQLQALSIERCALLKDFPEKIALLTDEQISGLMRSKDVLKEDQSVLVSNLPSDRLSLIYDLPSWKELRRSLTSAQFATLSNGKVIATLAEEQYTHLAYSAALVELAAERRRWLCRDTHEKLVEVLLQQGKPLAPTDLYCVKDSKLNDLPLDLLIDLASPRRSYLQNNKREALTTRLIAERRFDSLREDDLPFVVSEQLPNLLETELIAQLPKNRWPELGDHLPRLLSKLIDRGQIDQIAVKELSLVPQEKRERLMQLLCNSLPPKRRNHLAVPSQNLFKFLCENPPALLAQAAISQAAVDYFLQTEQFHELEAADLPFIPDKSLNQIPANLLLALPEERRQKLDDAELRKKLTIELLKNNRAPEVEARNIALIPLDPNLIAKLTQKQLGLLTVEQYACLSPQQVADVPNEKLAHLPLELLTHLPVARRSALLPDKHAALLRSLISKGAWQSIAAEETPHIPVDLIDQIPRSYFGHLSLTQIQSVPPHKIRYLTYNQRKQGQIKPRFLTRLFFTARATFILASALVGLAFSLLFTVSAIYFLRNRFRLCAFLWRVASAPLYKLKTWYRGEL